MRQLAIILENALRLAEACRLKNQFLEIMHTNNNREMAREKLSDWLLAVEAAAFRAENPLSEFRVCITACCNWSAEILNSLEIPFSNGFTEGCNNKTEVLKRVCFGFRDFTCFRSRILQLLSFCCLRKGVHSPVSCRVLPHSTWLFYFYPNI